MGTERKKVWTGTTDTQVSERETAHYQIAREAAAESFVLLKNEGILPLAKGSKVALYGQGASKTVKGGIGSGDVNERRTTSIYEGMKKAGFEIVNEGWIRDYDNAYEDARNRWKEGIFETMRREKKSLFDTYTTTPFVPPTGEKPKKEDTDTAIYVLSRTAGEGADRRNAPGDYLLSEQETEMLSALCKLYPSVLLVLNTGGIVDLSVLDNTGFCPCGGEKEGALIGQERSSQNGKGSGIGALLQISQPGMAGGDAFADCLLGNVVPSGKLTDSWAYRYDDYPGAENFSHNNGDLEKELYEEGIYVGYRYFDSFGIPVRFCFGYGLSYTEFRITFGKMEWKKETGDSGNSVGSTGEIALTALVKNVGEKYAGKEVVQVYVSCPKGRLPKEHRRLAAFGKTKLLNPGEEQELILHIPLYGLCSYDEGQGAYVMEPGYYGVWLGESLSDSRLCAGLFLKREEVLVKTASICPLRYPLLERQPEGAALESRAEEEQGLLSGKLPVMELSPDCFETETVFYRDELPQGMEEAKALAGKLSVEQCVRLTVGEPTTGVDIASDSALGSAGTSTPGSAGETSHCAADQNLASITLADGPAGLRLAKFYHVENGRALPVPFELSIEGGLFYDDSKELPGERYYQYCTAIPVGMALAQTWNENLLEKAGALVGREMEEFAVALWLAPGMNIHRNPLCGRNFEYYSEDPLLSGKMAAALTKGVQEAGRGGTTIKHFACNNQEDNRMHCDSILSERALREIYLKGFEIAVRQAQPLAIMTSYNKINGVHSANCYDICTKVARDEWGFAGLIMTDWTTTHKNPDCTAAGCILAGNDLIMPGEASDRENIHTALQDGVLPEARLRECVSRIVRVILHAEGQGGADRQ